MRLYQDAVRVEYRQGTLFNMEQITFIACHFITFWSGHFVRLQEAVIPNFAVNNIIPNSRFTGTFSLPLVHLVDHGTNDMITGLIRSM